MRLPGARAESFSKIRCSHLGAPFPKPEIVSSIEMIASLSRRGNFEIFYTLIRLFKRMAFGAWRNKDFISHTPFRPITSKDSVPTPGEASCAGTGKTGDNAQKRKRRFSPQAFRGGDHRAGDPVL